MSFWKRYYPVYALVIAGVITAALLADRAVDFAAQVMAQSRSAPLVLVLDPGHGGEDGGAAVQDLTEAELNLQIGLRLRDLCRLCGVPVVMTRQEDRAIYSPEAQTISEKKVSDLKNRVKLVADTPGAVLLSIHQNMYEASKYRGAQVFFAPTEGSRELAELIQGAVIGQLQPENHRAVKPAGSVYLLQHIRCAGVLVECGFLSNPEERTLLTQADYQKKLACAILSGVTGYLRLSPEEA